MKETVFIQVYSIMRVYVFTRSLSANMALDIIPDDDKTD